MNNKKIKTLCEYCAELVPVTIKANSDVLSDCPSCGPTIDLSLTIKCDICHHILYKESDESGGMLEIKVKELK